MSAPRPALLSRVPSSLTNAALLTFPLPRLAQMHADASTPPVHHVALKEIRSALALCGATTDPEELCEKYPVVRLFVQWKEQSPQSKDGVYWSMPGEAALYDVPQLLTRLREVLNADPEFSRTQPPVTDEDLHLSPRHAWLQEQIQRYMRGEVAYARPLFYQGEREELTAQIRRVHERGVMALLDADPHASEYPQFQAAARNSAFVLWSVERGWLPQFYPDPALLTVA